MNTKEHDLEVTDALKKQIQEQSILLYLKGTPEEPLCGFSFEMIQILTSHELPFAFVDVITHQDVRRLLPQISDWPTFPQLFIEGELIGGLDIVKQLDEEGKLSNILKKEPTK